MYSQATHAKPKELPWHSVQQASALCRPHSVSQQLPDRLTLLWPHLLWSQNVSAAGLATQLPAAVTNAARGEDTANSRTAAVTATRLVVIEGRPLAVEGFGRVARLFSNQ